MQYTIKEFDLIIYRNFTKYKLINKRMHAVFQYQKHAHASPWTKENIWFKCTLIYEGQRKIGGGLGGEENEVKY